MRGPATAAAPSPARAANPARPVPRAPAPRRWQPVALRAVWAVTMFTFLWFTWQGIERQITWYLAVDQFGYLTFAHDLLGGHVFHHWKPLEALGGAVPQRTDMLAQTYVRDGNLLYCRYAPGFPIVLAAWIALFGDEAAHYLNPTVYLTLLGLALAFQWRVFRSPWRAAVGTMLIGLFPTMMHLWGLTLTRDLAHHLFAFAGLFVLLPARGRRLSWRRTLVAGLAIGFAICIRPDGVLYLVAGMLMASVRFVHEHTPWRALPSAIAGAAVGVLAATSPFLAYNWAATGNPLLPTQGMELSLFPPAKETPAQSPQRPAQESPSDSPKDPKVGYPPAGWRGGTFVQVQGGGLKLSNLRTTLPGNWRLLLRAYSPAMLTAAAVGVAVAVILRPVFASAAVGYSLLAFLFYSCWPRPDGRYLVGVFVFLPMLMVEGTVGVLDLIRLEARRRRTAQARRLALPVSLLLVGAGLTGFAQADTSVLRWILPIVGGVTGLAALAAFSTPHRRVGAVAAVMIAICLLFVTVDRTRAAADRRAPFQRPMMYAARANMQRFLEPGAVVITSEEVGRPAENIEFYMPNVHALYLTDLRRWNLPPASAAVWLLFGGQQPYLFLPTSQHDKAAMLQTFRDNRMQLQLVADIPADRAMAHFVAAPFHRGMRMELYRVESEFWRNWGRQVRTGQQAGPGMPSPPASPPVAPR